MQQHVHVVKHALLRLYNGTHWFSDKDAWLLFRAAAFAETIGWTLLIAAILYRNQDLPNPDIFISVAGRLHGLFFMLYFVAVLLLSRSMQWRGYRILFALAAGVPPYGSLVYEKIAAKERKQNPPKVTPPKGYDL